MWTAEATGHEIAWQISSNKKNEPLVQKVHRTVKQKVATGWNKCSVLKTAVKHHIHITENMLNGQYLEIMVLL